MKARLSFKDDEKDSRIEFEEDSLERMKKRKWSKKKIKTIKKEWKGRREEEKNKRSRRKY